MDPDDGVGVADGASVVGVQVGGSLRSGLDLGEYKPLAAE